jgi:hypothetical protein
LKLLYSLLFSCAAFTVCAQQTGKDTIRTDTVRNRYLPTGIRVGTDVISLIKSSVQDDFEGWEVNADVDFNRYYLAFDYGKWARNFPDDSARYNNEGRYWRVGADVNFLLKDPERNMFFMGLRYGRSVFSENLNLVTADSVWGPFSNTYTNTDVKARWLELTAGIKVKIWKMIWLGYTARFKFALKNSGDSEMLPHDVPGYGRTDKETFWGFNYQVFIRIPFRPLPPLPPSKKKKK